FARVAERAMRRISLRVFEHLHRLDLSFHLSRRTGGLARDIERGTSGISFLLRFMVFNIIPTVLEIALIAGILLVNFSPMYPRAVDSLLNYETVEYFGNEAFEARQYDAHLAGWETARMKTRLSLSALNSGQAFIIAGSVTLLMVMAASQVASGAMTLGELVMI